MQGLSDLRDLCDLARLNGRSFSALLIQIYVSPRILEHLQPWPGFPGELIVWFVAQLRRSEAAFWMWHHDGGATVACGKASNALGGAVWVCRIHFRWLAFEVNVASCDLIAVDALLEVTRSTKVGAAFTVGNGNG